MARRRETKNPDAPVTPNQVWGLFNFLGRETFDSWVPGWGEIPENRKATAHAADLLALAGVTRGTASAAMDYAARTKGLKMSTSTRRARIMARLFNEGDLSPSVEPMEQKTDSPPVPADQMKSLLDLIEALRADVASLKASKS